MASGDSADGTNSNIDLHTGDSQNAISNNEDSKDSLGTNIVVSKNDQNNQNSSINKMSVSIFTIIIRDWLSKIWLQIPDIEI